MKKMLIAAAALFSVEVCAEAASQVVPKPGDINGEGRRLVWHDEFDKGEIDYDKWELSRTMYTEMHEYDNSEKHARVENGQMLEAGDELTEGSIYPHDLLRIKGVTSVQNYLIQEVQRVYRLQGIDINDKHIEVIVRQMLRKVRVEEQGDTNLLIGSMIDKAEFDSIYEEAVAEGKTPPACKPVLLGITKTALATDSFLSAASFQETTRVLTDAATKGKVDPLIGLKENVIIGKLIPAGTGMNIYSDVDVVTPIVHTADTFDEPIEF